MLTFIQIFNVQFDDVAYRTVEHVEAGGLLYHVGRFCYIDKVEDRSENLIHSLDVLNSRVKLGVNIKDASHIVIPVCLSLLFFIS